MKPFVGLAALDFFLTFNKVFGALNSRNDPNYLLLVCLGGELGD